MLTVSKDITPILAGWETPPHGGVAARIVRIADGEEVLQLRLELGVLQMCLDGRPDGTEPFGKDSLATHYRERAAAEADGPVELSDDEWEALDAELMQFYHRRIGLLATASRAQARKHYRKALAYYRRARRDAEHNLGIMDFIREQCDDEDAIDAHDQYRPLVLCHRTLAHSQCAALTGKPDEAIERVKAGIQALEELKEEPALNDDDDEDDDTGETFGANVDASVRALRQLERELRRHHKIKRTLRERLDAAVEAEDYEAAARLRDDMRAAAEGGRAEEDP